MSNTDVDVSRCERPLVFISYAREDEIWMRELAKQLKIYEDKRVLRLFVDTRMEWGTPYWEKVLLDNAKQSSVIILLLSPDFFDSTFIKEKELPVIERCAHDGAWILPVVVRPVNFLEHHFVGILNCNIELIERACKPNSFDSESILCNLSKTIVYRLRRIRLVNQHKVKEEKPKGRFMLLLLDIARADPVSLGTRTGLSTNELNRILLKKPISMGNYTSSNAAIEYRLLIDAGALVTTVDQDCSVRLFRDSFGFWFSSFQIDNRTLNLMVHPITVQQYRENSSLAPIDKHWFPQTEISYEEVQAFCARLNRKRSGRTRYRLPTFNEWKIAASEDIENAFYRSPDCSWFEKEHAINVGGRRPSRLGLLDLFGNVSEWTSTDLSGGKKAVCGGSYQTCVSDFEPHEPEACVKEGHYPWVGFRLVVEE